MTNITPEKAVSEYILPFASIRSADLPKVGGKNASLGEMYSQLVPEGILVPDGFAITAKAWYDLIAQDHENKKLKEIVAGLERPGYGNLREVGDACRQLIHSLPLPDSIRNSVLTGYRELQKRCGSEISVAVRSSATAEDLPDASFAGQHESFLNIRGEEALLEACRMCYESLYTDRAIKYREDKGFKHEQVALSIGVQQMVRSDLACSGVAFTLDPESGFRNVVHISASWGLGENIVKGTVTPDEFYVFKPTLAKGKFAVISRKTGSKEMTMVYAGSGNTETGTVNLPTPAEKQEQFSISVDTVSQIARWSVRIEEHYKMPMDIEWAIDGISGKLYVVQARPETVHSTKNPYLIKEFSLQEKGNLLTSGIAVGSRIATGTARVLGSPAEAGRLQEGDVLVARMTNPDWDPLMKKASALITDQGSRTSHAAIVARELGLTAVVGTINGSSKIKDGMQVTVSCAEGKNGHVYEGKLKWETTETDFSNMEMPATPPMLILGDPDQAFRLSFYPTAGVGLMRLEFAITNSIGIHHMAIVRIDQLQDEKIKQEILQRTSSYPDPVSWFTGKLAETVATIAAAFYPREVIVRMSDFKSNEYANLLGGKTFEPDEENPMLGFRGASRYYHEAYREGFGLECMAMKKVREEMGLTNVKLMIPFCRTPEEGRKVLEVMEEYGLKRGENGLEVYVMAEIPSNVLQAEEFAEVFDGFSIGSNDLTQLTLGIDRDSAMISGLFDENNPSAREMFSTVIRKAKAAGRRIGLCGQGPSDSPEFATFLVENGIDSISFNPDALIKGIQNMRDAETKLKSGKT